MTNCFFPKVTTQKIATIQANINDANHDIDRKFLFKIKSVHHSPDNYDIVSTITRNANQSISRTEIVKSINENSSASKYLKYIMPLFFLI
jgi:hypothetical protein